ncbi:O-succinylbenzoate synthase [Fictibacillus solisalsi]|uniref:o-succinylbenzoate synthase n=1 Tax=Fictibacillus solisalsi TaxID=459525 RepID=A0A1H0BEB7_9BACL|nr:o-succinylbenzoate synthase [Fictibacillus solisalsi]SDN43990.1 O-succinylbenzoate synthase [Fictibacillus solisalsi]
MESVHISQVILHIIDASLKTPFTTSFGTMESKEVCIVEVIDQSGISGWGETVTSNDPDYNEETTFTAVHTLKKFLIPAVLNRDITHPNEVFNQFKFIKRNHMAKAAIETAIWDVFAKKNEKPLYEIMGGVKQQIEVGKSIGIQKTPDHLVDRVEQFVNEGFKKIKVKIAPGFDSEYLNAVRKKFPDIPLMADANSAYSLKDMEDLKKLDDYRLIMIEQPLAHDDIIDHAHLQKNIETPICLDESVYSFETAKKAIELGSGRIINIKIGRVGGLGEAIKIHDLCQEHNIPVWCGGMLETGIGRAHNIQITTLPNFTIPGDTAPSQHYWEEDIISPEVVMDQGIIHIPQGTGIGYEVDRKKINKKLITSINFVEEKSLAGSF